MEIIDLSVTLSEDLPATWPTEPQFQMKISNWFEDSVVYGVPLKSAGPFQSRGLSLSDHTGTHCDAPCHFVPPEGTDLPNAGPLGTKTAEQLELDKLMGPAVVIDCRSLLDRTEPNISPMVGVDLLERSEREHGAIAEGSIALLWTGWDERYLPGADAALYYSVQGLASEPGWPAVAPEALDFLLERGVTTLGIDSPSVGALHDVVTPHVHGLSRDMKYIELLCNLGSVPPRGAWFVFLPLKLKGASAGPGRAIAIVDFQGGSK